MKNHSRKVTIDIFVAYDKEFSTSFWGYNPIKKTKEAIKILEQDIPEVCFHVINKKKKKKKKTKDLVSEISRILRKLKKTTCATHLVYQVQKELSPLVPKLANKKHIEKLLLEEQKALNKGNRNPIKKRLGNFIIEVIEKNRGKKFPKLTLQKNQFFLFFTGKNTVLHDSEFGIEGVAFKNQNKVLLSATIYANPEHTIAHELGHLLGARHTNLNASIMKSNGRLGKKMDKTNLKRIQKTLREMAQ